LAIRKFLVLPHLRGREKEKLCLSCYNNTFKMNKLSQTFLKITSKIEVN
jgi:hypothetical protein